MQEAPHARPFEQTLQQRERGMQPALAGRLLVQFRGIRSRLFVREYSISTSFSGRVRVMELAPLLHKMNPWWREPASRAAREFPVRRTVAQRVLRQLTDPRERRALVLLGPRQVGKTTLLLQTADELLDGSGTTVDRGWPAHNLTYFDFSDSRVTREVTADEVLGYRPAGLDPERPRILLLDEIRLAPRWDRWLKRVVDQKLARVVATDSAASLLRRGTRESGQGRWDEIVLEGLEFREFLRLHLGDAEDVEPFEAAGHLEAYLAVGGYPEHAQTEDLTRELPGIQARLRDDTVERAIYRDLARHVDDPGRVRALFVYLVQESGGLFNRSRRASDLETDARTVDRWLDLLEDTLLVARLRPRVVKPAKALKGRPKIYAADHGLIPAFAVAESGEETVRSKVFEAVVYRHLRQAVGLRDIFFYRAGRDEVDFVVRHRGSVVAIEVTSAIRPKPKKIATLRRIAAKIGASRVLLIHGGMVEEAPGAERELVSLLRFLLDPAKVLGGEA